MHGIPCDTSIQDMLLYKLCSGTVHLENSNPSLGSSHIDPKARAQVQEQRTQ